MDTSAGTQTRLFRFDLPMPSLASPAPRPAGQPTWQGNSANPGNPGDNVHAQLDGDGGGVYAYCETPIVNGWISCSSDWRYAGTG